MVGRQVLALEIGVRVPVPEQKQPLYGVLFLLLWGVARTYSLNCDERSEEAMSFGQLFRVPVPEPTKSPIRWFFGRMREYVEISKRNKRDSDF